MSLIVVGQDSITSFLLLMQFEASKIDVTARTLALQHSRLDNG